METVEGCSDRNFVREKHWLLGNERQIEGSLEANRRHGHGYFMVKFGLEVDREKVIYGGPWMVFDHCFAIRSWEPDFAPAEVKINKTLVWIRFPGLGMEYYDESVLLDLAIVVGAPVKVDIRTIDASRGKFARVCVELDLDKPVVGKFWFRNRWFNVEYEGLHLLCKKCGLFGHIGRNCTVEEVKENPIAQAEEAAVVDGAEAAPRIIANDANQNPSNL